MFFFDRYHARGIGWYRDQFDPQAATRLDVSHDYLFSTAACDRIATSGLDYRLLLGLRSPYRRAVSAYKFMWYQGRVRVPFHEALDTVDELLGHGDYGALLPYWIERHDPDRWIAVHFEALVADQAAWQRDLLGRCGLEAGDVAVPKSNAARPPALPAPVMRAARRAGSALRTVGAQRVVQAGKDWLARSNLRAGAAPTIPSAATLSPQLQTRITEVIARAGEPINSLFGFDPTAEWAADFAAAVNAGDRQKPDPASG